MYLYVLVLQKPDCVEGSIQALLSDLYPPFESTAPTLLSQLFTLIQGRYCGDALRCLLHFLVPAKHILDSVQQAACVSYPERLFLHEGWPLCLRDRVVIHLSPIDPLHLCPGDFYLQVTPFCDQSARILVCSRLEEAGLGQEDILIEETPIPETSYPCIFTVDWLTELNQDRNGTPLSHCLLTNEQGVVRLPWERVAVPEFLNNSQDRNIMAAAPSSYPPIPPPLPNYPETSSSSKQFSISQSAQQPVASPNYSVQTRILPAKHGIAVSLRLVDTSKASLAANQVSKESEQEAKPVVWVSPSTRDNQEKEGKTKNNISAESDIVINSKETLPPRPHILSPPALNMTLANPVASPNLNHRSSLESLDMSPCFRAIQFPEKPCTPCMQRKNIGKVSKAQELRCKYRDSYQAAIQNPLNSVKDKSKMAMCTVVEEESDLQQNISNSAQDETGNPWGNFHMGWMQAQSDAICKESGETNAFSYWKPVMISGGRDKSGRGIVELYGDHPGWRGAVTSQELFKVLLYFYSITRREIREVGLTVIFDARKSSPQPQLYKALMSLELCPRSVHSLLLLIDKDNKQRPERCPGIQVRTDDYIKNLLKLVEGGQLSLLLNGTLPPGRCDWSALQQIMFLCLPSQSVQQCMVDQQTLMRDVLEDSRLVSLQREGGAMLARLRKESELRYPHDAVDSVGSLYNQLEEQVHVLVQRSNLSLDHLQYLLQLRDMQGHLSQWFDEEGERHLLEVQSVDDSGEHMEQILNSFTGFLIEANVRHRSGTSYPQTEAFRGFVERFKSGLEDFLCRAEACGRELQSLVHVCDFCEQATALASECMDYLEHSHSRTPTNLDQTQDQPPVPDDVTSSSGNFPPPPPPADPELCTLHGLLDRLDQFSSERFHEVKLQAGTLRASRGMRLWNVAWLRCQEARQLLEERILERTQAPESGHCEHHYIDVVSTEGSLVSAGGQGLVVQSTPGPGHPQWDRIVSGALELGDRRFMESCYERETVKPEEKNAERADVPPQSPRRYPALSYCGLFRLQRVLEELLYTEREYMRSLGYILTHYLPLLDQPDVPQDLRGKRAIIFGNLEKLFDFHSHYFLPELEACQGEPALVARCFLRHSQSFGLYALYSKNKPKSDVLILHRRHDIFKKKQQELGDHMDLSSYLLRPIQRISKYSLLLQDMLSLVSSSLDRADIQAAADLVRFQMRHGNDLLTMDAIRDCDVNLKEQGQLIRQDEFTVLFRKKKCVRRVFLFEELILFSKTKKTDVGNDVYVYKQSFKTSDIGMTHNSSLSGLCFEIWFRRRKSEDTYTLRAASVEVKRAWTMDLERILWNQANHSREMRLQERVFMGIGHKPFLDIQPSDTAICDRAVNCSLPGRSKTPPLLDTGLV
uniref:Uncharacterized protein n=1 Tax=Periophthalmus magnuspinnatus TaxID=409849 RepID=A0A3B4B6R2_9GOBI